MFQHRPSWLCVVSLAVVTQAASAAMPTVVRTSDTPLCGLYCLYAAMRIQGIQVEFQHLCVAEYVSSSQGSSIADLIDAATDHGSHATALQNLTFMDLTRSPYPLILLVRSEEGAVGFGHYVLCVSADSDGAVVLDPPHPLRRVSPIEVERIWSGVGLIISSGQPNTASMLAASRCRLATCALIVAGLIVAVHAGAGRGLHPRMYRLRLPVGPIQAVGLLSVAAIFAVAYHWLSPVGLLSSPRATAPIDAAQQVQFLPQMSLAETRDAARDGAVLIDARLAVDFAVDHAINIPVNTDAEVRKAVLAGVRKDQVIIVFCKSRGCGYSYEVAWDLIQDGYTDVRIFRGGWDEWRAAM